MAPLPRRVQDQGVGPLRQVRKDGLHLALEVLHVGHASDVCHRVVDGGGGLLDRDYSLDVRREGHGERAYACIGIQE